METRTYEIDVITPLFGGGVDAGQVDPDVPIRPSSIRGHLRFWWRATRGAKFSDVAEIRQREGEIWGSTENPSPVIIEVDHVNVEESSSCQQWDNQRKRYSWNSPFQDRENPLPYILFPFQGKFPERDPSKMIISGNFTLKINIPSAKKMSSFRSEFNEQRQKKHLSSLNDSDDDIIKDVEAAAWAWMNFGGIGARTRRGCGALFCKKIIPENPHNYSITPSISDKETIGLWYSSSLRYFGINTLSKCEWPTMPKDFLFHKNGNRDAIPCWIESVGVLKEFRQGLDLGRDRGNGNHPGRSRWPEAESLRTAKYPYGNRRQGIHPVDQRMENFTSFPRVEFGMPIILEIRNERIKPTLQYSEEKDRMASPIILRPLKCGDNFCTSIILRFNKTPLTSAYVKPGNPQYDDTIPGEITLKEIKGPGNILYANSPMNGRCTSGSALDAFVAFAQENGNDFKVVP